MQLLPAHLKDAKEMARRLCDALQLHGLAADCRDPDSEFLTLQQTQELLAKAMGHPSWRQLAICLKAPHQPVYLDGEADGALTEFAGRMARLLGFDYTHGAVYRAISTSGAGFTPRSRREMQANDSPWGPIDEQEEIAPGVVSIITGSHGGLLLSPDRQAAMPAHLRLDGAAYEEDSAYNLVGLAFPAEAEAMGIPLRQALISVEVLCREGATPNENEANEVVTYLAQCVYLNRRPVRYPSTSEQYPDDPLPLPECHFVPTLGDWVRTLRDAPRVGGQWPTLAGPWHEHWCWQTRHDERQMAWDAENKAWLAESSAPSPADDPDTH